MINYKVGVFSYSFSHKKSYDFINILIKQKIINCVIAAPKKKIIIKSNWVPAFKKKNKKFNLDIKKLCENNRVNFYELKHDNYSKIKFLCSKFKLNIGIVSGARIIKEDVIKLFKHGIINVHPGKIPQTSGLDSFFWMINKNINPCVTAHFIDKHIDRGKIIDEKKIAIKKYDNFFSLKNRIYNNEKKILVSIAKLLKNKKKIKSQTVINYFKNDQLNTKEKKSIYEDKFLQFKKQRI